jgi:hypothetical protein
MALTPGNDDDLLGVSPSGSERNYVASLGRISGKLLSENLERQGVDLTFRNGSADPDLLYLDVTNMRLGVEGKRTLPATLTRASGSLPVYDLDVNDTVKSISAIADTQANIDNLTFNTSGTIGSITGPIIIETTTTSTVIPYAKLLSDYLVIDGNVISSISNNNIVLDPNGTGITRIDSNARITGNLQIQGTAKGNINVNGNLSSATDIIVGDTSLDTVTVTPDFTQSIIPGTDVTYSLGTALKRWSELQSKNLSNVVTNRPNAVKVSDQLWLDGTINKISGLQSNEDVELLPDTGITYIESTKWQASDITNLLNTPLTFASTGIGYTRIMGDNAVLIPAGPDADRRVSPELGETRWNTDEDYLECFDGSVWAVATGGGVEVSTAIMEDLSHIWTLTLG